jgi:WD40 repeat protein
MGGRTPLAAGFLLLAACGSAPSPTPGSPVRLQLERRLTLGDQPAREIAFSPDGAILATSSADGTLALWPTHAKGKPRLIRQPPIASLAFAPDGASIATGSYDGAVRLWRVPDGKPIRTLRAGGTQWSVAVSPDGTQVAAGGEDKLLRTWRAADGRLLHALPGHSLNVWKVKFSPDGRTLATSSFDRDIRLWDVASGRPLRTLKGHEQAIVGLDFSPDGRLLASGSDDSTVRLWRLPGGAPVRTIEAGNHTYAVAFSPDGQTLATAGRARGGVGTFVHQVTGGVAAGENVRLWRVADGALLATASEPEDALFVAWSPDGKWLATATEAGRVSLWRLARR